MVIDREIFSDMFIGCCFLFCFVLYFFIKNSYEGKEGIFIKFVDGKKFRDFINLIDNRVRELIKFL